MNFVSPGVYVIEKDLSDYPVSVNPSVVGVVGFADKGPTNKATLITSQEGLIKKFAKPSEDLPGQGLEGSLEVLEATNSLYYVRAYDSTVGADASAVVSFGGCPAILVSALGLGVTANAYFEVQVLDENGVSAYTTFKTFSVPSGTVGSTGTQGEALAKVFGGALDGAAVGAYYDSASTASGYIVGAYSGSGTNMWVKAYSDSSKNTGMNCLCGLDPSGNRMDNTYNASGPASGIRIWGYGVDNTNTASSLTYTVESLYPGAGYNAGTKANGDTSGNSIEILKGGNNAVTLQVNEDGAAIEQFKVSLISSGFFIEDIINTGEVDIKSEIIKGNIRFAGVDFDVTKLTSFLDKVTTLGFTGDLNVTTARGIAGYATIDAGDGDAAPEAPTSFIAGNPRFIKPVQGTTDMVSGNSGAPTNAVTQAAALVGNAADKTGVYALDDDLLNIGIGLVPGIATQSVQNALVTLAEDTQNFIALVAPPYGVGGVQQAIDWTNGQSTSRTAALNSSYAAIYWPWVKTYDQFSQTDRWYDPSIYAARQMAYTDEIAESWFAPAGYVRGRLTKPVDAEVAVNQGDRDTMYSGGNVVNPIVNFPQQGLTIFGQRTAQRLATSLDRVNVRRLMIIIRKILLASTRQYAFEPNDATTWERVENTVIPLVDEIRRRRGITEFKVICDETTNTPVRVDRNELWCKVLIKPTKAAEIIVFELNLTNQSANIDA